MEHYVIWRIKQTTLSNERGFTFSSEPKHTGWLEEMSL